MKNILLTTTVIIIVCLAVGLYAFKDFLVSDQTIIERSKATFSSGYDLKAWEQAALDLHLHLDSKEDLDISVIIEPLSHYTTLIEESAQNYNDQEGHDFLRACIWLLRDAGYRKESAGALTRLSKVDIPKQHLTWMFVKGEAATVALDYLKIDLKNHMQSISPKL